jgi:hypothetical protein
MLPVTSPVAQIHTSALVCPLGRFTTRFLRSPVLYFVTPPEGGVMFAPDGTAKTPLVHFGF